MNIGPTGNSEPCDDESPGLEEIIERIQRFRSQEQIRNDSRREFEVVFQMSPDRLKPDWGFNLPSHVMCGRLDEVKKIMEARLGDLRWNPLGLDTKGYNYFTCEAFKKLGHCSDVETIKYFLSKCQLQKDNCESTTHFCIDEETLFEAIANAYWSEAFDNVAMLFEAFEGVLSQKLRLEILKLMDKANPDPKIEAVIERLKRDLPPACFAPGFSTESMKIKKAVAICNIPGYYPGKFTNPK